MASAQLAEARGRGLSGTGCSGCHSGTDNSKWSDLPVSVEMGDEVTLSFTVEDPDAQVGGIFVEVEDTSRISVASGSRMAVTSAGVTHVSPKDFQAGRVTFPITWKVPNSPGATRFVAEALAANGNGRNSGDESNYRVFDIVYGCEPKLYYADYDGDGFGRQAVQLVHCADTTPDGYSEWGTDCDDNTPERNPEALEYCNQRDDDCDGEIDEEAIPAELYPDADGDGYYSNLERQNGEVKIGCVPLDGYAALGGDCSPENELVNPGQEEVCDGYLDEDCDGRVDERVRPICGEGWCRRESRTCDIKDCTPGEPFEEECNFLDDDCDGVIDEGHLCGAGMECLAGECREALSSSAGSSPSEPGDEAEAPSRGPGENDEGSGAKAGCHVAPGPARRSLLALVVLLGLAFVLGATRRLRSN